MDSPSNQGPLGRARAVFVVDFHTITVTENFWRASPFQKPNLSPKPAVYEMFLSQIGGWVFGCVCVWQ